MIKAHNVFMTLIFNLNETYRREEEAKAYLVRVMINK